MRIGLTAVVVAALVAAIATGTGSAASSVTVSLFSCYGHGGHATVPAGSDVTVRIGWAEENRGRVQSFLDKQTTTASLNGTAIADASSLWGEPEAIAAGYVSFWSISAGTLANAGDTAVVTFQVNLSDPIPEGKDPNTGKQVFAGPGNAFPPNFGCTITAV